MFVLLSYIILKSSKYKWYIVGDLDGNTGKEKKKPNQNIAIKMKGSQNETEPWR